MSSSRASLMLPLRVTLRSLRRTDVSRCNKQMSSLRSSEVAVPAWSILTLSLSICIPTQGGAPKSPGSLDGGRDVPGATGLVMEAVRNCK